MLTRVSIPMSWLMSYAYRSIFVASRYDETRHRYALMLCLSSRTGETRNSHKIRFVSRTRDLPSPDPRFDTSEPYRRRRATAGPTNSSIIPKRPLLHSRPERRAQAWETTFTSNSLPSPTRSLRIHHNPCYLCTNPPIQDEQATPATNSHICHTRPHATGALCQ
jgi:hypothetical protein